MNKQVVVVWLPNDRRVNDIIDQALREHSRGVPLKELYQRLQTGIGYREAVGVFPEDAPVVALLRGTGHRVYQYKGERMYNIPG